MPKREFKVIQGISEIIAQTKDYREGLRLTVENLADSLAVDSCSIFVFNEKRNQLVLEATYGLNQSDVRKIRVSTSRGILGRCFRTHDVINLATMQEDPDFQSFGVEREEEYSSLLLVPLTVAGKCIGILGLNRMTREEFSEEYVDLTRAIASPLAVFIINAGLSEKIEEYEHETRKAGAEIIVEGIAITDGVVRGSAYFLIGGEFLDSVLPAKTEDLKEEKKLFSKALKLAAKDTMQLQDEAAQILAEADAAIFYAHLLLLEDPTLMKRVTEELEEGYTLRSALKIVAQRFEEELSRLDNDFMRERVLDMKDVIFRIFQAADEVEGVVQPAGKPSKLKKNSRPIVVTRELLPSQLIRLPLANLAGVVCEQGGATTHVAILAKALQIPMIVGAEGALKTIDRGDPLILDCATGYCYVLPSRAVLRKFHHALKFHKKGWEEIDPHAGGPLTSDGELIRLGGNVSLISELPLLEKYGAMGVGLYRTEFMFMIRSVYPSEEEQYQVFKRIVEAGRGASVTIRILDVGGDKPLPYVNFDKEMNPYLGWRGMRFLLSNRDYLEPHLKAILRTTVHGRVNLLFPMISDIEEILIIKEILQNVENELTQKGIPFNKNYHLGVMIEVPSCLWALQDILPHIDFVSIGTNDLIQYIFAVDRGNSRVAKWYRQFHPILLRIIDEVARTVHNYPEHRTISLCGEIAGNLHGLPLMLGAGVRYLSMNPWRIPKIKRNLHKLDISDCQALFKQALDCKFDKEVVELMSVFAEKNHLE